jgi:hypothetical protein
MLTVSEKGIGEREKTPLFPEWRNKARRDIEIIETEEVKYSKRISRVKKAIVIVPSGYEVTAKGAMYADFNINRKGRVFSHLIGWIMVPNLNPTWGKRNVRIHIKHKQDLETAIIIAEQIEHADFDVTIMVDEPLKE